MDLGLGVKKVYGRSLYRSVQLEKYEKIGSIRFSGAGGYTSTSCGSGAVRQDDCVYRGTGDIESSGGEE